MDLCSTLCLYRKSKVNFTISEYSQGLENFKIRKAHFNNILSSRNFYI